MLYHIDMNGLAQECQEENCAYGREEFHYSSPDIALEKFKEKILESTKASYSRAYENKTFSWRDFLILRNKIDNVLVSLPEGLIPVVEVNPEDFSIKRDLKNNNFQYFFIIDPKFAEALNHFEIASYIMFYELEINFKDDISYSTVFYHSRGVLELSYTIN